MGRAHPCPECHGKGTTLIPSLNQDLRIGCVMEMENKLCSMCEGHRCVWIEPIKQILKDQPKTDGLGQELTEPVRKPGEY